MRPCLVSSIGPVVTMARESSLLILCPQLRGVNCGALC